jgi:hypothetical protein
MPGLLIFMLCFVSSTLTAAAECRGTEETAPVRFRFADAQYQQEWLYQSFQPSLLVDTNPIYPDRSSVRDDEFDLVFCIPKVGPRQIRFNYGPRQLGTSRRPAGPDGIDSTIFILLEPAPDWLVVSNATWDIDHQSGSPLITFTLQNLSATPNVSGPQVNLLLSPGGGACFGLNGYEEVNVGVFIAAHSITTVEIVPGFGNQVQRTAKINDQGCNFSALIPLGTALNVNPGDTVNVRFKLNGRSDVFRRSNGSRTDLFSFTEVPVRVLAFAGQNIFPTCLEIKFDGQGSILHPGEAQRFCSQFIQ